MDTPGRGLAALTGLAPDVSNAICVCTLPARGGGARGLARRRLHGRVGRRRALTGSAGAHA